MIELAKCVACGEVRAVAHRPGGWPTCSKRCADEIVRFVDSLFPETIATSDGELVVEVDDAPPF